MNALEPGDLILVRSEGRFYAAARHLTRDPFDHIAVVVSDGRTLNIDKPVGRFLPSERLLRPVLEPTVLRAAWKSPEARAAFVRWIESLAGREYDTARTLRLVPRMLLKRIVGLTIPLERPTENRERWICTDAVLLGLERYATGFEAVAELPLDWNTLNCGTTNDFLVISRMRPDILRTL